MRAPTKALLKDAGCMSHGCMGVPGILAAAPRLI